MEDELAGVAGAARIKNIGRAGLARAEKPGKRLDQTSKSRAVNDDPPPSPLPNWICGRFSTDT